MEKVKIYIVDYCDGECCNVLAAFSSSEAREKYLKKYRDLEDKFGKNFVSLFSLDEYEIELDEYEEFNLKFYRRILYRNGNYYSSIRALSPYEEKCYIDKNGNLINPDKVHSYQTWELDEKKSMAEAKRYFEALEKRIKK